MKKQATRRKNLPVNAALHGRLKEACQGTGMKLYALAENVLTAWLSGDLYYFGAGVASNRPNGGSMTSDGGKGEEG